MEENVLPDWYPAPIHQRELSMEEWATEIFYRVVGICLVRDGWKQEAAKHTFKNIVLNLYGNQRDKEEKPIPVGHEDFPEAVNIMNFYEIPSDFWKRKPHHDRWVNCKSAFPANFVVPIFINTHFDEKTILSEVKRVVAEHKQAYSSSPAGTVKTLIDEYKENNSLRSSEDEKDLIAEYRQSHLLHPMDSDLLDTLANSPFSFGKNEPSKQAKKGNIPYGAKEVAKWNKYKVLDFIDLTIWGMLNDIEYKDGDLAHEFWHNHKMTKDKIRQTTKRWAFELLHPSGSERLNASAYANENIKNRS